MQLESELSSNIGPGALRACCELRAPKARVRGIGRRPVGEWLVGIHEEVAAVFTLGVSGHHEHKAR
jgi:hypothetical protein